MEEVVRKLKAIRIRNNFTQEEVAKRLKVSSSTYVKYENNPKKLSIEQLEKLSEIYNENLLHIFFKS